jgi:mono/diheme cytochrome c family protein
MASASILSTAASPATAVPGKAAPSNGPAPSLAKTEMPYDGFKGQLRDPANDMPAYSTAVLSDQEIADMYAYVQSLPGARSAKDISILNN